MNPRRSLILPAATALLALTPLGAQTPPAPAPAPVPAEARIDVRVYEGFATLGPVYGARHTPLAVDVGAALVRCPDGNTAVRALDIGGWNYQLATPCNAPAGRGHVRVDAGSARAGAPVPAGVAIIRCDPATWRCAPVSP